MCVQHVIFFRFNNTCSKLLKEELVCWQRTWYGSVMISAGALDQRSYGKGHLALEILQYCKNNGDTMKMKLESKKDMSNLISFTAPIPLALCELFFKPLLSRTRFVYLVFINLISWYNMVYIKLLEVYVLAIRLDQHQTTYSIVWCWSWQSHMTSTMLSETIHLFEKTITSLGWWGIPG